MACHGRQMQRGKLRLDSATTARQGGRSGPGVVPRKPADSLVLRAIHGEEDVKQMPPKGPRVPAGEVLILRQWIRDGAVIPKGEIVLPPFSASSHWSFQPIRRPKTPLGKQRAWVRNPIDSFVLARLEKQRIKPSEEADRTTLARRVSLDLLGLPPSPAEIDSFVNDQRPHAYERLVDRLLASPHFGERWGRHWLDLARYADSNGYSIDSPRSIWKYRDWVIQALNEDMPFDRFTTEQLAGDLLPAATLSQRVATGFHRNTMINEEGGIDLEQFRVEAVVDRTNTTATVFLGLTLGCAQCHNHKFDPLSQKEYYQLYSFFNGTDDKTLDLSGPREAQERKKLKGRISQLQAKLAKLERFTPEILERWEGSLRPEDRATFPKSIQTVLAIAPNGRTKGQQQALEKAYRNWQKAVQFTGALTGPFGLLGQSHLLVQRNALEKQISQLEKQARAPITTLVVQERKTPRKTYVQINGDFLRQGATVTPAVPAVLPALAEKQPPSRLTLARWLVSRENPLTARVQANRIWQHYFGAGLVETENDFGTQGAVPSHPELLDWLACELLDQGWSVKQFHRSIVTSAAYRQSSRARPDLRTVDLRNRLLARQNRLRLDAEVVRDSALKASGLLTPAIGGPSVFPPQPAGVYSFTQVPKGWVATVGPDRFRRGLYTFLWRSAPFPALTVFDAPDAVAFCTRRNRSNTPLQALTLLNDKAFLECAEALAVRMQQMQAAMNRERLAMGFRLTTGRIPASQEMRVLERLVGNVPEASDTWLQVARVLLNLDEFMTRE
jgi:hypothetical protein